MMRNVRALRLLLAGLVASSAPLATPIVHAIPVVASAVAPVSAVALSVVVSDVAHAGYQLDGTDDRIDIGTMGALGSSIKQAAGWSLMCWVKTSQTSVSSMIGNFTTGAEGAPGGTANQSLMFNIQTGWTSDFASDANHVLLDMGDQNDNGLLFHQELSGITIGDNVRHHHAVTVIATGNVGANNNSGATLVWYADGVATTLGTHQFQDGLDQVHDFTSTLAIGAEKKNGGTYFDWTAGTFSDCRVYLVALTAVEINDIVKMNGRDSVSRGLIRRWPLQGACREVIRGDTCTPQNGPTLTTVNELYGVRRR